MIPGDLIRIARSLASGSAGMRRGRPRQTDLCRAVSAAYYALFHALAGCCADMLAGATPTRRSYPAWRQTYRALEHGLTRRQCSNRAVMSRFAPEIQEFGEVFVDLQRRRHNADYDPGANFSRSQVMELVEQVERVTARLDAADRYQRRAFALYVLLPLRQ